MNHDLHGIIYTLRSSDAMRDLVTSRNSASVPFCGRYRLIDFALSNMVNAGVRDVGVIMERDYQSLLDHLNGGKDWGLSRRNGGLRMLPPFGLPEAHAGSFNGCMEALRSVRSYIEDIREDYIVLSSGDYVANIDLTKVAEQHVSTGAAITAVCIPNGPAHSHHRFVPDEDGFSSRLIFSDGRNTDGLASTEIYVVNKDFLLKLMDYCQSENKVHFHRDALMNFLGDGGRVGIYKFDGFFRRIESVLGYYKTSMELLQPNAMNDLFPENRPVHTKGRAEVSTYYSRDSHVRNSMLADGCIIEGEVRNCVIFRGVRIGKGAKLENCVIMQDTVVGPGAQLSCVIADKDCTFSEGVVLTGNENLPIPIPKGAVV